MNFQTIYLTIEILAETTNEIKMSIFSLWGPGPWRKSDIPIDVFHVDGENALFGNKNDGILSKFNGCNVIFSLVFDGFMLPNMEATAIFDTSTLGLRLTMSFLYYWKQTLNDWLQL